MKKILILLVLAAVGLCAIGFQRGWFQLASEGQGGKTNVTLTVDKDKIREDEAKAINKVQHAEEKIADKASAHAK